MQVEYDRTSFIVLQNFLFVYNFLWSCGDIICVLQTHFIFMPRDYWSGGILFYPCPSVHPFVTLSMHSLSGYLLLQFWSYSFNILKDVYTHNGDVHVHMILIFIKYLIMTGSWIQSFFYAPATKPILDRIIPISPQVIHLYLHIRNEKLKVLSVYKLSMIEHHTQC